MSFKARMSVAFTLLVAVLLAVFGVILLARSEALREAEFYGRLEDRALLVEHLLDEARMMPVDEAEHLTNALRDALPNEALTVLGTDGRVIFRRAQEPLEVRESWKRAATANGVARITQGDRQVVVLDTPEALRNGVRFTIASAIDERGIASIAMLRRSMLLVGLLAVVLTAGLAWVYAQWALIPVRGIVQRVRSMKDPSERLDVVDTHRPDEMGRISIAFNGLLARLDDAFQMQRTFIASASHELRTPLTVVRGNIHQALALAPEGSDLRAHLRSVDEQAMHMQDLLDQLLWLARTHGPSGSIASDEVRLDEVAERAMERCRVRYPHRPIRFRIIDDGEGQEPIVKGNAVLLTAAFYNMLTNAAKYGGEEGISLVLGKSGRSAWCVAVHDAGKGMSPQDLERVRELFFRSSEASITDGQGIGLALVDRIAKVHQGRLDIETEPGVGTSVSLLLPAFVPEGTAPL